MISGNNIQNYYGTLLLPKCIDVRIYTGKQNTYNSLRADVVKK